MRPCPRTAQGREGTWVSEALNPLNATSLLPLGREVLRARRRARTIAEPTR